MKKTLCYGLRYRPRMTQTAGHPFPDKRRGVLQSYACYIHVHVPYTGLIDSTRPKIESRFEDVNVLDTVQNYSIGTFIWGSPIVYFVWGLPYSSNRHVTPVSVRGCKGLTCSIQAPHCPRFDTLRQSVSNRAQLFLAVYGFRSYHSKTIGMLIYLVPRRALYA